MGPLEDVVDFCCDVFAEIKKLGQSIVASFQHAEANKGAMADIHLESASLYLAEVKQDSYDPLRVGRFFYQKGITFSHCSVMRTQRALLFLLSPNCSQLIRFVRLLMLIKISSAFLDSSPTRQLPPSYLRKSLLRVMGHLLSPLAYRMMVARLQELEKYNLKLLLRPLLLHGQM